MPVMPRDRFEQTMTFAEYVDQMQVYKEPMREFTDTMVIPSADVEWWRSQGNLKTYVLTEDNCGDALSMLPVMAAIARECPNIDLRVAHRDENLDIMDRYLHHGRYRAMPLIIFMDEEMNEIGNFKERTERIERIKEAEALKAWVAWRAKNWELMRQENARALREVVALRKDYP